MQRSARLEKSTMPLRLTLAGADTFVGSTLCARCPLGVTGCCAAPPAFTWADVGRIVGHGGRDWLGGEIEEGRLRPGPRGLVVERRPGADGPALRCVYHGPMGCTIPPERRSATCNDYVCEDALAEGAASDPGAASAARNAHERLAALYARWDEELGARVRARWPAGAPWDGRFLDMLGREQAALARATDG